MIMADCIFCKIAEGQIPSEKVFEDDNFVAFRDINPQSPVHILVVPRRHIEKLSDCTDREAEILSGLLLTANRIAGETGLDKSGYRAVVNSGREGGQVVMHLHLHLMGGHKLSDIMG